MRQFGMVGGILLFGLASGCADPGTSQRSNPGWIGQHGGLATSVCPQRVQRICSRLAGGAGPGLRVAILHSNSLVAYSWPDGEIFLTQGLVDSLDDEELAAAIAHEMGHLINETHWGPAAGLLGSPVPRLDREAQADRTGQRLLQVRGLSQEAMVRMLAKVRSACPDPACQRALQQRIARLSASSSPH